METADLRYPIGPFQAPAAIDGGDRQLYIQQIAETPAKLRAAVDGLCEERLDTPYRPGGWTVRQVAHHLPDSHMNSYVRFRLALTEDEPLIRTYREDRWAELADARHGAVEMSLALLEALHLRWAELLRALTPADLARTLRHPERGAMTLDVNLALYAWHGRHHIAQIDGLRRRLGWA